MELLRVKFPEMERFPLEEREAVLRRCIESPEMQRFRARWGRYFGIALVAPVAVGAAVINLVFHWSAVVSAVVVVFSAALAVVAAVFLKLFAEYRLIRRWLRRELQGRG